MNASTGETTMTIDLGPQRCDMIGEDCERLPIGEVTELQNLLCAGLTDEEYCEFLSDELGPYAGLYEVDGQEMWDRFCQPMC
jgi:hypothetical protein